MRRPTSRGRRHATGFFLADTIVGLIVVGVVAVVLATSVGRQQKATRRLGDQRAAARLAENVLVSRQANLPPPPAEPGASVTVARVEGEAPAGQEWAEVSVTYHGRAARLTGLVPAGAASRPAAATRPAEGGTP